MCYLSAAWYLQVGALRGLLRPSEGLMSRQPLLLRVTTAARADLGAAPPMQPARVTEDAGARERDACTVDVAGGVHGAALLLLRVLLLVRLVRRLDEGRAGRAEELGLVARLAPLLHGRWCRRGGGRDGGAELLLDLVERILVPSKVNSVVVLVVQESGKRL